MKTSQLVDALRMLQPPEIIFIDDVYIFLPDTRTKIAIQESLQRYLRNASDLSKFERNSNRHFIVANLLDYIVEERRGWAVEDLITVAKVFASLLRDKLRETFPSESFIVEIIGGTDDAVEDEPLELCVTFYKAGR